MGPMQFRTVVDCQRAPQPVELEHQLFCIGSCFAEVIGARLRNYRFELCLNPTGVVYNPLSVQQTLLRLLQGPAFSPDELVEHDGFYHSFAHHGSFSGPDPQQVLFHINQTYQAAATALSTADTVMITLGTASIWQLRQSGRVVANCHRMPATLFERRMLSVHEIVDALYPLLAQLLALRPHRSLICTISPVRHLRDDARQNTLSKARLHCALESLQQRISSLYYFPAWELMMDELRDYRFYDSDMVHPSAIAQDYIWQRFGEAVLSERSREFVQAYTPILHALHHRLLYPNTHRAHAFAQAQLLAVQRLQQRFPQRSFDHEQSYFANLLQ